MVEKQPDFTDFLLSMPDEMITSEAVNQIAGTLNDIYGYRNYVDIFEYKHAIQERARETDEDENEAEAIEYHNNARDNFYGEIIRQFKSLYGILLDTNGSDNIQSYVKDLYNMFVVRRHSNLVEFMVFYIMNNKASLAARFSNDRITNMTVKNARKEFGNKVDATLAIHCYELIDQILSDDELMNPETVLEVLYQGSPEDMEYVTAHTLFETVILGFDIPKYIERIRTIYSDPVNNSYLKSNVIERLIGILKLNNQQTNN